VDGPQAPEVLGQPGGFEEGQGLTPGSPYFTTMVFTCSKPGPLTW
jgi:hypothetical protein